jgi:hypothetical protein
MIDHIHQGFNAIVSIEEYTETLTLLVAARS